MAESALGWLLQKTGTGLALARQGVRFGNSKERIARSLQGFTPSARDVIVATYVKSGTNWMMQIALQIAWRGAAEFEHIHDLVPWPDTPSPGPVSLDDPAPWQGCPTGLRIIKTHGDADTVPLHPDAKYLVVLRDLREVIVSAYHFALPLLGLDGVVTPEDWLGVMADSQDDNPWLTHTLSWWALRDAPNVCVLFFPDIKRDPGAAIDQVAALMGVSLTAAERAAVIERSSLTYMRSIQDAFRPVPLPFITPRKLPEMIRRGAAGGSDELYTAEQLAPLVDRVRQQLAERCPDFPYDEKFGP